MTSVQAEPPGEARSLAQICKALGNPVRISILRYVLEHPNCIGNQILLHLPDDAPHAQSTLSQHLHQLREAGLLEAFADGAAVCYQVNRERIAWLCDEIEHLREHSVVPAASTRPATELRR